MDMKERAAVSNLDKVFDINNDGKIDADEQKQQDEFVKKIMDADSSEDLK